MTSDRRVVGQQSRKQHEQVEDGEREQAMSGAPIGLAAPAQLQRERNEDRSADGGDRAIDRAGKSERPRQQRSRRPEERCRSGSAASLRPVRRRPAAWARRHGHIRRRD